MLEIFDMKRYTLTNESSYARDRYWSVKITQLTDNTMNCRIQRFGGLRKKMYAKSGVPNCGESNDYVFSEEVGRFAERR